MARIGSTFAVGLPLRAILENQAIAQLSKVLIEKLMEKVAALSDTEAQKLL